MLIPTNSDKNEFAVVCKELAKRQWKEQKTCPEVTVHDSNSSLGTISPSLNFEPGVWTREVACNRSCCDLTDLESLDQSSLLEWCDLIQFLEDDDSLAPTGGEGDTLHQLEP